MWLDTGYGVAQCQNLVYKPTHVRRQNDLNIDALNRWLRTHADEVVD